jgi:hypothetical protein
MCDHQGCSVRQISAELAYHGRQYYDSIWRSFLARVRFTIASFSDEQELHPDYPDKVKDQFLLTVA